MRPRSRSEYSAQSRIETHHGNDAVSGSLRIEEMAVEELPAQSLLFPRCYQGEHPLKQQAHPNWMVSGFL